MDSVLFVLILLLLASCERLFYQLNLERGTKNRWPILFRCLIVVFLSYYMGFVREGGTDYQAYEYLYNMGFSAREDRERILEYAYKLLMVLFRRMGFSFQQFHFVCCMIMNTLIVSFVYRYKYPLLSLLLFVATIFFQEGNLIRQMMSIAIFLYSTKYIAGKDMKKYLVCVFLACMFHASSIVLLPIYWVNRLKPYPLIMMIVLAVSIYMGMSKKMYGIFQMDFGYSDYGTLYSTMMEADSVDMAPNIIMYCFLLLAFWDKKNLLNNERNSLLIIFFIGAILNNFSTYGINMYRLGLYFKTVSIVIIPQIIDFVYTSFHNRLKINIGIAKLLIYLFVFLFYVNVIVEIY